MAQQRGLEPPILCRIPAFQAGRLPLSHCCIGSGSWVRTNNPLGQNQVLFQLSYAAIWAQAEQGSPARANRGKGENNMARFRGWRQRRASNPQARRPPVFRTGWHSHLPSLPYWKSWTPCALLYLYYMHFLQFIFSGASKGLFNEEKLMGQFSFPGSLARSGSVPEPMLGPCDLLATFFESHVVSRGGRDSRL